MEARRNSCTVVRQRAEAPPPVAPGYILRPPCRRRSQSQPSISHGSWWEPRISPGWPTSASTRPTGEPGSRSRGLAQTRRGPAESCQSSYQSSSAALCTSCRASHRCEPTRILLIALVAKPINPIH
ncbi:hypothetical protein KM043_009300 [Ampulex compressa]|nr:hypothetical protein KM043_009300 [Ampulex compressa]